MVNRLPGKKVIGVKQTIKALKANKGKELYVATDAAPEVVEPVISIANNQEMHIQYVDSMKELGKLCGIDVGAAVALILSDE